MTSSWHDKIMKSTGWILMVRPSQVPLPEDILTRAVSLPSSEGAGEETLTPQSKLVELLQMLQYKRQSYSEHQNRAPPLGVLLSCYDELATEDAPGEYCRTRLPMLDDYLSTNWPTASLRVFAVSPLGQALSATKPTQRTQRRDLKPAGLLLIKRGIAQTTCWRQLSGYCLGGRHGELARWKSGLMKSWWGKRDEHMMY